MLSKDDLQQIRQVFKEEIGVELNERFDDQNFILQMSFEASRRILSFASIIKTPVVRGRLVF